MVRHERVRWTAAGAALALASAVAACGGSSHPGHSTATAGTPTTTTSPGSGSGIHARFTGQSHRPVVGRPWHYLVTVSDGQGHPLSGTVDIEFVYGGAVVGHDTPPTHPVRNGRWHDFLKFPAPAVGEPLNVQAVVHTSLGVKTLDFPIRVSR